VPPDVVVLPTAEADRSTLGRLLQLYVHDLSQFRETIGYRHFRWIVRPLMLSLWL